MPVRLRRRTVLAGASALPLLPAFASGSRIVTRDASDDARPGVFWHWMNGNIAEAGIVRDLAAMRAMGLGSAYLFNTGVGIPRGPVDYASPRWRACVAAACGAARREGLALHLHHAAGYAGTGGAWVSAAQSQQRLFWTEARAEAGAPPPLLARPRPAAEHYEDICVLAYPALPGEGVPFRDAIARVTLDGAGVDRPSVAHPLRLERGGSSVTFQMRAPFEARAITLGRSPEDARDPFDGPRDRPPRFVLEASADGIAFRRVAAFAATATAEVALPSTASFPAAQAPWWRLSSDGPSWLTDFDLHGSARLPGWPVKTNLAPGIPAVDIEEQSAGISPDKVIDVSRHLGPDGRLAWSPPPGRWTIVRIGHGATGKRLSAAPDSARFRCIDMFDSAMVDRHFTDEIDPLLAVLGTARPAGLFADSFESGRQNWTRKFPARFAAARGYPLGPWLLAMTGRIVGDAARTEKALFDVRRTQAALMAEQYYGRLREQCARRGLGFAAEPYGNGSFDALAAARASGTVLGEFWAHYTYGADAYLQLATSAAHASGDRVVACEAFTGAPGLSGWSEYPAAMKAEFDRMTTMGLTKLVTHVFAHQPHPTAAPGMTMGPFGMHFDRNNGWTMEDAAAWSGYVARLHGALRGGEPVVDIACIKGDEPAARLPDLRQPPYSVPRGYAADMVDVATLTAMRARSGRAVNAAGIDYRCLVLPPLDAATPALLEAVIALVQAGVPLLHAALPSRHPGAPESRDGDADVRALSDRLAALPHAHRRTAPLAEHLKALRIMPDHLVTGAAGADINVSHRLLGTQHLYFIANNRRRPERCIVSLRAQGAATLADAVDGSRAPARQRPDGPGRTAIDLDLPPAGAVLVTIDPQRTAAAAPPRMIALTAVAGARLLHCWINPDTRMIAGRGLLLVPGADNAIGVAAGRDGLAVLCRRGENVTTLQRFDMAIGGWTHVALLLGDDRITLYRDGSAVGTVPLERAAQVSDEPPADWERGRFEFQGEATLWQPERDATAATIEAAYRQGLPVPERSYGPATIALPSEARAMPLSGPWSVAFQPGRGAPAALVLDALAALDRHDDPAVAHFAGVATYRCDFTLQARPSRARLDLGRVAAMATVTVNGRSFTPLWTAPFALELAEVLRPGRNRLSVAVTVLPPNRLIGDESLPPEAAYSRYGQISELPKWYRDATPKVGERVFFSTWRHYRQGDPLFAAGLIGPVSLLLE